MPSFKFHIVTVVGIFVALALGIVVGTLLSDNIIIESQMSTIELMQSRINSLEGEKNVLLEQTQNLGEDIKLLRSVEDKLFKVSIERYRDIENVTVIAMGERFSLYELELVKNDKLSFENVILINPNNLDNERLGLFLGIENNVEKVFSEKLAFYLHNKDDLSLKYLEQLEVISLTGNFNLSNQKFLIYLSGEKDSLLIPTAQRLFQLNQRVFVVTDGSGEVFKNLNTNIIQIPYIKRSTSQIELLQLLDDEVRMVMDLEE